MLQPFNATTARVPLRVVGVPLRKDLPPQKRVPGEDFPPGVEFLDVAWLLNRLTVERLRDASDDELREMRSEARICLELATFKAKATHVQ